MEIGSFLGLSAIIMGRSNRQCRIICIDPCDLSGEAVSAPMYGKDGYQGARQFRMLRLRLSSFMGLEHKLYGRPPRKP